METDNQKQSAAEQQYPDRYYAQFDSKQQQPSPVIGWWDMWGYSSLDGLPPLSELLPLSEEFWKEHMSTPQSGKAVQDGHIVDYDPPYEPPPLKEQAQIAMQKVQQQASMVTAMGETFGPQMREYVQKLRSIIDGSDTTSKDMPKTPEDVST